MPSTPVTFGVVLAASALLVTACGSGSPDKTKKTDANRPPFSYQLKQAKGAEDVSNVFVKLRGGDRVSLSAPAPGHKIMAQQLSAKVRKAAKGKKAKKAVWSKPVAVYTNDNAYCSAIALAQSGGTVAATVTCSASKTDRAGTGASVILLSTDLKTWKEQNLPDAVGGPSVSPSGKYASFGGPDGFTIWSAAAGFKSLQVRQSPTIPAVGAVDDTGNLVIVRSKLLHSCVVELLTASPAAPTPKLAFTSAPLLGKPNCRPLDAKVTKTDLKADFDSTTSVKKKGRTKLHHQHFAAFFKKSPSGSWSVE